MHTFGLEVLLLACVHATMVGGPFHASTIALLELLAGDVSAEGHLAAKRVPYCFQVQKGSDNKKCQQLVVKTTAR
jgi:hypothetical protein